MVRLSGTVSARRGNNIRPVNKVSVTLDYAGNVHEMVSNNNGEYAFEIIPDLGTAVIRAAKTDRSKASRGVDVGDIVDMRKHILARAKLPGVLEMLSADANRDGSIDVVDIVAMRKVILARTDYFSTDDDGKPHPVWRFVNSQYLDRTIEDAFNDLGSVELIELSNPTVNVVDADFIGIKLGDANLDWEASNTATTQSRRYDPEKSGLLSLGAAKHLENGNILFEVTSEAYQGLLGAQFGLKWDDRVLTFRGVSSTCLPNFNATSHLNVNNGFAVIAWDDVSLNGTDTQPTAPIMSLEFAVDPQADRGTSLQLIDPLMVGYEGRKRAPFGLASYYHPEGGTMLHDHGPIRSMQRNEGRLSLEFATLEGSTYVVESSLNLASGQWEAITIVEGRAPRSDRYSDHRKRTDLLRVRKQLS